MEAYHDREWGIPVTTDHGMFEHLVLEGFQSGLSWRTVLHKREAFHAALHGFDAESLLRFTDAEREAFLANPQVIRNRLKLEAALHNARTLVAFRDRHGKVLACDLKGIRRAVQGIEVRGVQIHWVHHPVRPHAGDRTNQRPLDELSPLPRGQSACPNILR
jgi:3-methyladenine DNA glycosylase Tag